MDYKNGKIYKIVDNAYTKMYIGSTTQSLSKRFSNHKKKYKDWLISKCGKTMSFDIFDEFGVENCKIELIENYECNSKEELERKEGEHIKNNDCVNKYIAGRTPKEYYEDNKDKKIEQAKKYYENSRNKILEQTKKYYEDNKDKKIEYAKDYYINNKKDILNKLKLKAKEKIICECGCEFRKDSKSKHIKTKKHIKFMEIKL